MPFEYIAFISYNRKDIKWASKLQRKIEFYKLPSIITREIPDILLRTYPNLPKKMPRMFRDMTELEPGQDLSMALKKALDSSQYLIVICSPNSAKSEWVNKEIEYFIELGRYDNIIPIIVDGKVHDSDGKKECYPPALLKLCEKVEIIGTDIRDVGGFNACCIKIIARILNIRFEQLWRRYERHMRIKQMSIACLGIISVLISIGVMWLYLDRNSAYSQLSETYSKLQHTMADLNRSNADLKLAYDSIVSANDIIHLKTDSLLKSRLEIQKETDNRKTAQLLKEQQTLMTAVYNSEALLNSGNALEAAEVALKQLKSPSQYSYSPRLEYCLRTALDILESNSMQLIKSYTPSVTFIGYSSRDDQDIVFIEDGKYFFSYSAEIRVFESLTGKIIIQDLGGVQIAGYDASSQNITGYSSHKLFRFHWPTGQYVSKKIDSQKCRNYDGVSRDGKRVFTENSNGEIIWDAEKMEIIAENLSVGLIGKIEDGVSFDGKKYVTIYDGDKGYEVEFESKAKRFINSGINYIQYATDGETIISKYDDGISVDNNNHNISLTIDGDFTEAYQFAISGNKRYLAAGNKIYDLKTGLPVDRYEGSIMKMWMSYDGSTLYTYDNDYIFNIWHRNNDNPLYKSITLDPPPFLLESPGIYSTQDGSLWTIEEKPKYMGERNNSFEDFGKKYNRDRSLYADTDNPITIYDVKTGISIGVPIKINTNSINHVSFSPDNRLIAVTAYNLKTTIYDIKTGEPIQILPFTGDGFLVGSCEFGDDGKLYIGPEFQYDSQDKLLWRDFYLYPDILKHAESVIQSKRKALQVSKNALRTRQLKTTFN